MYSFDEVMSFVNEEDVKFVRLSFCDISGKQKNISIMSDELERVFRHGASFDATAVDGFDDGVVCDLLLFPDPSTISILPWRPSHGRVVRMFCDIRYPDGREYEKDSRAILKRAVKAAADMGVTCNFGSEYEFYLFESDENGCPTKKPFDNAGYFDVAPADKGENIRRDICFTLTDMGIKPESSHHEEGPGQNEINFRYSDALTSADNAQTFKWVVETAAVRNGVIADFSPKPLPDKSGNGLHINISVDDTAGTDRMGPFMAGILSHIKEMTAFLNPREDSYARLGCCKAPKYITWSHQNRSQLIRTPAIKEEFKRIELRSPDPCANPYIAYALLIYAGLDGMKKGLTPPAPVNLSLFCAANDETNGLDTLPSSLDEAKLIAKNSEFILQTLPKNLLSSLL